MQDDWTRRWSRSTFSTSRDVGDQATNNEVKSCLHLQTCKSIHDCTCRLRKRAQGSKIGRVPSVSLIQAEEAGYASGKDSHCDASFTIHNCIHSEQCFNTSFIIWTSVSSTCAGLAWMFSCSLRLYSHRTMESSNKCTEHDRYKSVILNQCRLAWSWKRTWDFQDTRIIGRILAG